jgi:hypothetical protein
MYELSLRTEKSLTDLVVGFLDDARTWWGLGEAIAETLRQDAEKLNLSQRDYIFYLLSERYEAVRKNGVGWEKDKPRVALCARR